MPRLRPLFHASAATALVAAALLTAFGTSGRDNLLTLVVGFALFAFLSFIASVVVIFLVGVPAAHLLSRLGWASRTAFLVAGVTLPLAAVGFYLLYDWCCIQPGPFQSSFQERMEFEGAAGVAWDYARKAAFAAICGAVAANFYWVAQHRARSNASQEGTRER